MENNPPQKRQKRENNEVIISLINDDNYGCWWNMHKYCKKVIFDDTIIMNIRGYNVKYTNKNGFHLYDLVYLCHRQYLHAKNIPENETVNAEDINWVTNNDDYSALEHSLDGFKYYPETKIVLCSIDH